MPKFFVDNWYDSIARYQTTPGVFSSPDPLAEKYCSLSPYAYCAGNPVRYIDPYGKLFSQAALYYVNKLIDNINIQQAENERRIKEAQKRINAGGISEKKAARLGRRIERLNAINSELEEVRNEIAVLQASNQVYHIKRDSSINTNNEIIGKSYLNTHDKVFYMELGDKSLGLLAHELKHAYQFETGHISTGEDENGMPFYYITDEIEAYARGALFGGDTFDSRSELYKKIQNGPADATKLDPAVLGDPSKLQGLANKYYASFRINGVTYIYNITK